VTFWLILAYVAAQVMLAAWAGRGARSDADYLVAGRKLGTFAVAMSVFATWFASESLIATSGDVASDGLAGARAEPFAYAIGIFAIGFYFARRLRAGGHITIAGFLADRFGPATESLAALVIALSATTWSAAQLFAFATILANASPLGFPAALAAATLLVMTYTLFGGLAGDVWTDIVQGAILILGISILLGLMVAAFGGVPEMLAAAPQSVSFSLPGESFSAGLELWLIPIIGTMVSQEALARTLGARSPEVARTGALAGGVIYLVVGLIPVSFGLFAPALAPVLGITFGEGEAFLPSLAAALFPPWLYIIFTGALISAILSSVDSALLAVSGVATESGYRRLVPDASPTAMLRAARFSTVIASLAAALVAAQGESLRNLVLDASAIAAVLALPMIAGLSGLSQSGRAAVAAILVQGAVLIVGDWWLGIEGAFLAMLASGAVALAAVTLAERRTGATHSARKA
jgi:SSS family transporter